MDLPRKDVAAENALLNIGSVMTRCVTPFAPVQGSAPAPAPSSVESARVRPGYRGLSLPAADRCDRRPPTPVDRLPYVIDSRKPFKECVQYSR